MATQEVIDALTLVAQECLESKIQAGFDANAALTVDIAMEIAGAMESKANEYTNVKITEVTELLTNGEVDLGPFTDFMSEIYELLDGDNLADGFQIFNLLAADATAASSELQTHASTLATLQGNLTTFQATLSDHESRIDALEAAEHTPVDCEDCHDEILNLVDGSMAAACLASDSSLSTYRDTTGSSILSSFADEMDPITFTPSIVEGDPAQFSAIAVGRRISTVSVAYPNGFNVAMVKNSEGVYEIAAPTPLVDGDYTFTAKSESGAVLSSGVIARSVAPAVAAPTITSFEIQQAGFYDPAAVDENGMPLMDEGPTTYEYGFYVQTPDLQIDSVILTIDEEPSLGFNTQYFNSVARQWQFSTTLPKALGYPRTLTVNAEYFDANGVSLGTVTQVFDI